MVSFEGLVVRDRCRGLQLVARLVSYLKDRNGKSVNEKLKRLERGDAPG